MLEDISNMWDDFKTAVGYMPWKIRIFGLTAGILKIVVLIAIINFAASISRLFTPMEKSLMIVVCFGWWLNNFLVNEVKDWSKNRR